MDHLFLHCPFSVALWLQSPWQIRIDQICPTTISAWVIDLCSSNPAFVIPIDIRQEILNFVVVGMEMTWWLRNQIRVGQKVPQWQHSFDQIRRTTSRYWKAALSRKLKRAEINRPCRWSPPPLGWIKINFDAAFSEGVTHPAVIVRDSNGTITTTWTSELMVDGPFSVEASAAHMALKIGELQHEQCVIIEGDALSVIQSIYQHIPILDWWGEKIIQECQSISTRNMARNIQFTPRASNRAAHNPAAQATRAPACGFLNPASLPPDVISCDSEMPGQYGTGNVLVEMMLMIKYLFITKKNKKKKRCLQDIKNIIGRICQYSNIFMGPTKL